MTNYEKRYKELRKKIKDRIKLMEGSEVDCYDCYINTGEIIENELRRLLK